MSATRVYVVALNANLYFGGKLIRLQGQAVAMDRLGSVRALNGAATPRYYPYGMEYTTSAQDREKFGTYYRDSTTGLDYADQRYYASTQGRFLTADPYWASGGTGEQGSWNRYAYVKNDPVNFNDPQGLFACAVDGIPCAAYSTWLNLNFGFLFNPQVNRRAPIDPPPPPKTDSKTNQFARSLLKTRLKGFADSNCDTVLAEGGIDTDEIINNYNTVLFFDAQPGSVYSDAPLSLIVKGDKSRLTIGDVAGPQATTITGTKNVLLDNDFFGANLNKLSQAELAAFSLGQQNTLLHEVIHVLTGLKDPQLFRNKVFLENGLDNSDFEAFGNTGAFTAWLQNDCKK